MKFCVAMIDETFYTETAFENHEKRFSVRENLVSLETILKTILNFQDERAYLALSNALILSFSLNGD